MEDHDRRMYLTGRIYSLMLDIYDSKFSKDIEIMLLKVASIVLNSLVLDIIPLNTIEEHLAIEENVVILFRQKGE